MKSFTDTAGRAWTIVINVAAVKRVRALLGINLYALVDDRFAGLSRLLGDPVDLVDVLYVLCKDEATALGVSDEDFGRAMAGDAIERAADAFLAELTDFFPTPRVRQALGRLIEAGGTMRDRLLDRAMAELEAIDLDAELDRLIASSGGSPAPSASTPAPSP